MSESLSHQTVLPEAAVEALVQDDAGCYVDCTFGRGGHSRRILSHLGPQGSLLAIDKDPDAVEAGNALAQSDSRFEIISASFSRLQELADSRGLHGDIAGVLLDLGVSSPQLDAPERGFSFIQDGPLDMRMNPNEGISAADWLNEAPEQEIANVIYRYGEERFSRRMARAIVAERQQRPLERTLQLAEIIKAANPSWEKHKHPATRAFQAIRIFINRELEDLETCLAQSLEVLRIGGRLVVISFHSLEDRIVKQFIARQVRGDDYPPDLPVQHADLNPRLKKLGRAVRAQPEEVTGNPRARSAIMRIAEKIA